MRRLHDAGKLVVRAKNGDTEAYDILYRYYKPCFVNTVEKTYGKSFVALAEEDYKRVFDNFFKNNVNDIIGNYIIKRAKTTYNSYGRENLISKASNRNEENISYLANYYKEKIVMYLYEKFKAYFSYDEIDNYEYILFYKLFSNIGKTTTPANVLSMASSLLKREKTFSNEKDVFFVRFLMYGKPNDKIISYYEDKYHFLLDQYKNTKYGYSIGLFYKQLVKETLNEVNNPHFDFEYNLKKKIVKKKEIVHDEIIKLQEKRDLTNGEINKLYIYHEYVKDFVYNKYKDAFNYDIKNIITIKYDDFFNVYINSNRIVDLSRYLFTRYNDYFINMIKKEDKKVDISEDEINQLIGENYYMCYSFVDRAEGYYPASKVLNQLYLDICDRYFDMDRKRDFKSYVYYSLYESIRKLKSVYNEEYLDKTVNYIKNKKLIPEHISYEYFEELKKYYIENDIFKYEFFDIYLYNEIKNFDYNEYLKIREVKKYNENRVLCKKSKK